MITEGRAFPVLNPGALSLGTDSPARLRQPGEQAPDSAQAGVIDQAAREFEAMFVKTLLDSAFKNGFGGMGDSGQADQIKSMWNRELADAVTAGEGLGLRKSLIADLGGHTVSPAADFTRAIEAYRASPVVRAMPVVTPVSDNMLASAATAPTAVSTEATDPCFDCPERFISTLQPIFEEAARDLGVSPRILMAQAALETGWGSALPQDGSGASFNLFGIKADRSWEGPAVTAATTEYSAGVAAASSESFRRYTDYAESVRDYVRFMQEQPRYAEALDHGGSDERYIRAIADAGYATDPHYAARVLQVADSPRLSGLSPTESAHDTAL